MVAVEPSSRISGRMVSSPPAPSASPTNSAAKNALEPYLHADAEARRLNQRHQREHHAHRGGGGVADVGDEIRVRRVVQDRNQLACRGGQRQSGHETRNRRLGHAPVLFAAAQRFVRFQ